MAVVTVTQVNFLLVYHAQERNVEKVYLARVSGAFPEQVRVVCDAPLAWDGSASHAFVSPEAPEGTAPESNGTAPGANGTQPANGTADAEASVASVPASAAVPARGLNNSAAAPDLKPYTQHVQQASPDTLDPAGGAAVAFVPDRADTPAPSNSPLISGPTPAESPAACSGAAVTPPASDARAAAAGEAPGAARADVLTAAATDAPAPVTAEAPAPEASAASKRAYGAEGVDRSLPGRPARTDFELVCVAPDGRTSVVRCFPKTVRPGAGAARLLGTTVWDHSAQSIYFDKKALPEPES